VKVPILDLAYLMLDGLRASNEARRLVVMGCSLPPEDAYIRMLLTNFLHQRDWKERKLVIVDPRASQIREQVPDYWGVPMTGRS
jgi:hypothetical protein